MTDWLTRVSDHLLRTGGTVQLDSRAVRAGDVFIALPGHQVDGRDFIRQVLGQADVLVVAELTDNEESDGTQLVWVDNLRHRLGQLAEALFAVNESALTLIGVTGTNGKTSVSHFLAQALSTESGCGVIGTLGYGLWPNLQEGVNTTPDVIANHRLLATWAQVSVAYAVMEVSSHALVQGRVDGLRFRIGLFTQLTRDHLDYHDSMEDYFLAKARLFDRARSQDAVICVDDSWGRRLAEERADALTVSGRIGGAADVVPMAIDRHLHGLTVNWQSPWGSLTTEAPLIGTFNVANLALVLAVLGRLGWSSDRIESAMNRLQPVAGRMQPVPLANGALCIVDYAHTPDALEKALVAARHHTAGSLSCVFGCGGDRDRGKRPLMAAVAAERADRVWITSDNNRNEAFAGIVGDMRPGIPDQASVEVVEDRSEAIRSAIAASRAGDVIVLAGKGHERYQETRGKRIPYSELDAIRNAEEAGHDPAL